MDDQKLKGLLERAQQGGAPKYHEKNAEQKKLFARDRIARLFDKDSFVEDALLANSTAGDLPADGVVTGVGKIDGRAGGRDGQRLHREGRLLGPAHRGEDPARAGDGASA